MTSWASIPLYETPTRRRRGRPVWQEGVKLSCN